MPSSRDNSARDIIIASRASASLCGTKPWLRSGNSKILVIVVIAKMPFNALQRLGIGRIRRAFRRRQARIRIVYVARQVKEIERAEDVPIAFRVWVNKIRKIQCL